MERGCYGCHVRSPMSQPFNRRAEFGSKAGRILTSHSIFRSLRRSAYFRDRGALALELVTRVPEADLGTAAAADVVIWRMALEAGAVRRGPYMMLMLMGKG